MIPPIRRAGGEIDGHQAGDVGRRKMIAGNEGKRSQTTLSQLLRSVVAKLTPYLRASRPPPRTGNHSNQIGDGAAGDLSIVRPAAAAPPRRPEPVEQHRAGTEN